MQTQTKTALESKVIATNRVNQACNEQFVAITEALLPFVGKPIQKADGSLRQQVRDALPDAPEGIQRWIPNHSRSLCFAFKTSENYGDHTCVYAEQYVYVADLDATALDKVYTDAPEHRTDYTVEEVIELRKVAQEARDEARRAESALGSFGTYDR